MSNKPKCVECGADTQVTETRPGDGAAIMQRSNEVLMRDVSTFRRAVRYGLVEMKAAPIVFYFETLAQGAHKES